MFDSLFPKHWTTLQRLMWLKTNALARAVYEIVSGNPVSFTAKAAPLRQLSVAFSPVQSGTGDPSPDNVRPISGWSSLTVEQRGKNLFAPVAYSGGTYNPTVGTTWTLTEITGARKPVLTEDGFTVKASANNQTWTFIQPVKYGIDYYTSVMVTGETSVRHTVGYLDKNFNVLSRTNNTSSGAHNIAGELNPPENAAYRYLLVTNATATTETITFTKPYFVIGDSAVEYTPYTGRSISISLGQTIYSGYVDVVTGQGEIDKLAHVFTGNETWVYIGGDNALFYTGVSSITDPDRRETMAENGIVFVPVAGVLRVYLSANPILTAESNLNEIMTSGIKIVYGLEHPIPIQLTPQEVQSLAGDNVLFSDANGDLTVEYRSN